MLSLGQSLYMTGVMLGSPVTGMASDRFGRRPILLICLLVSSALSILLAFIDDVYIAIVLRFITGFFISVSFFLGISTSQFQNLSGYG